MFNPKLRLILGVVLVVIGSLMVPLPIRATIAEGEIQIPEQVNRMVRMAKLNFVFNTYNTSFSFTIDDNNITVWCEKIEFTVLTSETNNETKVLMFLRMENCCFKGSDFKGHIGKLTLYVNIKILEDKAVCSIETTTSTPIYQIIGNLLTNWEA